MDDDLESIDEEEQSTHGEHTNHENHPNPEEQTTVDPPQERNNMPPPPVKRVQTDFDIAPNDRPAGTMTNFSTKQAEMWAPWRFRIYGLDDTTMTSAKEHAESIIRDLPPISIKAPPHAVSTDDNTIPLDLLRVTPPNPTAGYKQTSAEIGFAQDALANNLVDPRALEAVRMYVQHEISLERSEQV